jgi:GDP-4-dehydro-6-deoxy-D-mannose reductase
VNLLVTGADGFVGGWLIRALLDGGHRVTGIHRTGGQPSPLLTPDQRSRVRWRAMELGDSASVAPGVAGHWDGVVHLAALASGAEARRDPGLAWEINAAGTARVAESLEAGTRLLLVSTGEVYGMGQGLPHGERDPVEPVSPYAASKAGAEVAALEAARRRGLGVIVARAFPHTGPGQDPRFVVPAFARRLMAARRDGRNAIETGNLDPIRDLLDVRDVATAYIALLERGVPGEVYNVASGAGHALRDVLDRLEALLGVRMVATLEPGLSRTSDIKHLVGNPAKLRTVTGWAPRFTLDRTLQDLLDAQTD